MTHEKIRVTVWNEFLHERNNPRVRDIYPQGIHTTLGEFLQAAGCAVKTATLDEPEHGLSQSILDQTDVLIWWGHLAHDQVDEAIVTRVQEHVLGGMGLIALHSAHYSKIFRRLMGTSCQLKWREVGEKERLWVVDPSHPIVAGLPPYFEIPQEEMYGEFYDIPAPDALVMISWFQGGEVFRSGCCFQRGRGRIFYFRPGHETFPTYHQPEVQHVIVNAVRWAAAQQPPAVMYGNVPHFMD